MATLLIDAGGVRDYRRFTEELERDGTVNGARVATARWSKALVTSVRHLDINGVRTRQTLETPVLRCLIDYEPPTSSVLGATVTRFTPQPECFQWDLSKE